MSDKVYKIEPAEKLADHHELGPSAYTWLAMCPGFGGRKTSGPLAIRGTAAHARGAAKLLGLEPPELTDEEKSHIEPGDLEAGEWYAEQLQAISGGTNLNVESKVLYNPECEDVPRMKGVFGTVDSWWVDEFGELNVCDFKTFDRGEKDHSPQMEGYAILICSHFPEFKAKPIHLHVAAGGIQKILSYVVTFGDAVRHVSAILKRAQDPEAERSPCDACQYCEHSMTCKGVNAVVAAVEDKTVWSGLSLAAKKVVVDAIKPLIRAFDEELKAHWESNEILEDKANGILYKRIIKNPNRVCTSISQLGMALEPHHIPADQFIDHICSVSKTACEEALIKANPGMKKKEAGAILDSYFQIPANGKPSFSSKRVA